MKCNHCKIEGPLNWMGWDAKMYCEKHCFYEYEELLNNVEKLQNKDEVIAQLLLWFVNSNKEKTQLFEEKSKMQNERLEMHRKHNKERTELFKEKSEMHKKHLEEVLKLKEEIINLKFK